MVGKRRNPKPRDCPESNQLMFPKAWTVLESLTRLVITNDTYIFQVIDVVILFQVFSDLYSRNDRWAAMQELSQGSQQTWHRISNMNVGLWASIGVANVCCRVFQRNIIHHHFLAHWTSKVRRGAPPRASTSAPAVFW